MVIGGQERGGSPQQARLDATTPVLLDGTGDRRLRLELLRWLLNPEIDQIDMAVSFIMKSGLALIADHLEAALRRGASVRILTTDYLDITDPDALAALLDLADWPGLARSAGRLEVRVFHDPSVSFHPKAYRSDPRTAQRPVVSWAAPT